MKVNMHEAKTQLSALGRKAWKGEKIVIAKAGKPYLLLIPYQQMRKKREPGGFEDRIAIHEDFDKTPDEVIAAFEGALPQIHKDPFDRMLIAQAQAEDLTIVTHDKIFESYDIETLIVP